MTKALEYLQKLEWSMGHGQCPECHGLGERFRGDAQDAYIGHEPGCTLAEAINEIGGGARFSTATSGHDEPMLVFGRRPENTSGQS